MKNSKQIAGLIGPTLVVLSITEGLNLHIWATNIPQVIYLNGTLLFVAGLSIVRAHNSWSRDWPVLITLTGWAVMFFGLFRMFVPEARQGGENVYMYALLVFLFLLGVFLSYKGYRREDSKTASY